MAKELFEKALALHKTYSQNAMREFHDMRKNLRTILEDENIGCDRDGSIVPEIGIKGLYSSEDLFVSTISIIKEAASWYITIYGRSDERTDEIRSKIKKYFKQKGFKEPDEYSEYDLFMFS